jgi:hypothetical protein
MPDLLPESFGTETLNPPIAVLREQADHLAKRTGGLVLARVAATKGSQGEFLLSFILEVPALDDYNYLLFTVSHPLFLYPLNFRSDALRGGFVEMKAETPDQFETTLRTFFAHAEVGRIISALKAQAKAVVSPSGKV